MPAALREARESAGMRHHCTDTKRRSLSMVPDRTETTDPPSLAQARRRLLKAAAKLRRSPLLKGVSDYPVGVPEIVGTKSLPKAKWIEK